MLSAPRSVGCSRSGRDTNLLILSFAIFGVNVGLMAAVSQLYFEELGYTPGAVGLLAFAGGLIASLFMLPVGLLADAYGRKPFLLSSYLLGATATTIFALISEFPHLLAVYLLFGVESGKSGEVGGVLRLSHGDDASSRYGPLISAKISTLAALQLSSVPLLLDIAYSGVLAVAAAIYVLRTELMNMAHPLISSLQMKLVHADERATMSAVSALA